MKQSIWLITCFALTIVTATPFAQSRKGAPDPISGAWTGELARQGADKPIQVTFQLKLDAKGAITGTMAGMPNPADVKTGTFDAKTGALKLQVGKVSEPAVLLTLQGTVAKGLATGRFTGEAEGTFKIAKKQ